MSDDAVTRILRRDPRFARASYDFVRRALRQALDDDEPRHVTPRQLLDSIRDLAREEFGPLARIVLHDWGVNSTEDFGEIVFNLVDEKELGKTDDDRLSDFAAVYDFDTAFPPDMGEARVHAPDDELDELGEDDDEDDD